MSQFSLRTKKKICIFSTNSSLKSASSSLSTEAFEADNEEADEENKDRSVGPKKLTKKPQVFRDDFNQRVSATPIMSPAKSQPQSRPTYLQVHQDQENRSAQIQPVRTLRRSSSMNVYPEQRGQDLASLISPAATPNRTSPRLKSLR